MKPEIPGIDQDKMVSPHAQEVEFALILSRMINTVKEDPSQMRLAIYEFARARLKLDAAWADEPERKRISAALETAIQGVEQFSARYGDSERLQPPTASALIGSGASAAEPPATSMVPINPAPDDIFLPGEAYSQPAARPAPIRTWVLVSAPTQLWIGFVLFAAVAGFALFQQRMQPVPAGTNVPPAVALTAEKLASAASIADPSQQVSSQQVPGTADAKTAAASSGAPPFPLPGDYGVYALNENRLSELQLLPEQVPDKRIAMSTPVSQPSHTTISDGKAKFVVFRRDLAGNAPDRMEVRVVARVVRALMFDAKGKANFTPVSDVWNIRNISYEFRVRPIPGNPEMLLIQSENADFALPAGRYVLVLKSQGYDFTVAGKVTDPSQCLERTDAANGEFYSDCQKQ
jgi:hypothetical protein